jgi:transposase
MDELSEIKSRYDFVKPFFNEKARRLFLAAEAKTIGWGGIEKVSRATGVSSDTISKGCKELEEEPEVIESGKIRKPGGGRKKLIDTDPTLLSDLDSLIEPTTRGDPESPLRWTCKSTRKLARELKNMGHNISHMRVADILHSQGYSLQSNQKIIEGDNHPDRNAQFILINNKTRLFMKYDQPVISVDTKKKELVGNFKNGGREFRLKGNPVKVLVHDFKIPALGKVNPYGVYDISRNEGWVSVGTDHDTSAFAVESIRQWWNTMGKIAYPDACKLLITADSGGSNGYRVRLWKAELQKLADDSGLEISVSHFPPGTSKWNKIEHRLFSFITQNWRGKPLISHEAIVNLIAATTTQKGLRVVCGMDKKVYPKGIKISDKELKEVNLTIEKFHGEWNYTIKPNEKV